MVSAFGWYRERNATAADGFRSEVLRVIDGLSVDPMRWPVDRDGYRRRVLRRYSYSVWFVIDGSTVTVLAIAHHRRRPGAWPPLNGYGFSQNPTATAMPMNSTHLPP